MKARNLDQNIVYFPKVDSERIKKRYYFIKTRNPFLDLKRVGFGKEGNCAAMTRSENSFILSFDAESLYRKRKSSNELI